MIAEVLLVLAGHDSSLFPNGPVLNPAFVPLLHPGEQQAVQSLALVAFRYRHIRAACARLSHSSSRYICAFSATLRLILKDQYESLVVETEAKVLARDPSLVAAGTFVPLSSIRALFSEWDAPLAALVDLVDVLEAEKQWKPGSLIDLLLTRSRTGVHRIASILSCLSSAVQRVWRSQITAFIVHGSLSPTDSLASQDYTLVNGAIPSCVSPQSRDSIQYVGRAVATVKAARWQKQLPTSLTSEHTNMLDSVLPQDQHAFDRVVSQIRIDVSEWLWINVLTQRDVADAVDSLGNYFLLRNGEFSLALIREIERLKLSRLTMRSGSISIIRDQDLNHALLRASLGTAAQQDPSLSRLRFSLPSGPLRPLLPSLATSSSAQSDPSSFHSHLLGTPLVLSYAISWPLDLFLDQTDLTAYSTLFGFLSALRKTHTGVHTCWTSLSNAQRARRRWTGLGEGGTTGDLEARKDLLRCGWGIVRDMGWFLDTLLGYIMTDVVDVEFRKLKETLAKGSKIRPAGDGEHPHGWGEDGHLDFTTLRTVHAAYLDRLLNGCLLNNTSLTSIIRSILECCEQLVAQVERWGGDVLPALLFEGSLEGGSEEVGVLVKQRWQVVSEMNQMLRHHLASFYEQLTVSTSQQLFSAGMDGSKSMMMNASFVDQTIAHGVLKNVGSVEAQTRRLIERLLLRLDYNGEFTIPKKSAAVGDEEILAQGGIVA